MLSPDFDAFESRLALFDNPPNIDGPAAPTIHLPEFSASAHPGDVLALNATSSNGQAVSYHVTVGSDIAYISIDNRLVLQRPGLVAVQAFQHLGGNNFAYSETRYLAVFKRSQSITFRKPSPAKFKKGRSISLVASSTSNLPITFKSSSPRIATITGNKAIMKRAGRFTVTASQAGDGYYEAAASVSHSVKLAPPKKKK